MRPVDKVFEFLDRRLDSSQRRPGVKLPSAKEVSQIIGVSSSTVRNAYHSLAGRGLVRSGVGKGSFWMPGIESLLSLNSDTFTFGINVNPIPEETMTQSWSYRIYGGLMRAIVESKGGLNLKPLSLDLNRGNDLSEAELRSSLNGLDGLILTSGCQSELLKKVLEDLHLAHVMLNPPSISHTEDFVAPDYYRANFQVGKAFALAGRRRILLFLAPGPEDSVSCQIRQAGFLSGLFENSTGLEYRKLIQPDGLFETSKRLFSEFLSKGWIPDAVCTAGDEMALAACEAAIEFGLKVPQDLSLVGGNGLAVGIHGKNSDLTAMVQPLERIGEELIKMLHGLRRNPLVRLPGVVLPMTFWPGKTTLPKENKIMAEIKEPSGS